MRHVELLLWLQKGEHPLGGYFDVQGTLAGGFGGCFDEGGGGGGDGGDGLDDAAGAHDEVGCHGGHGEADDAVGVGDPPCQAFGGVELDGPVVVDGVGDAEHA